MAIQDDIKKLLDEQNAAFADFKSENDKRLAQIEKNGTEHATTSQNVEALGKKLDTIQDALKAAQDALKASGQASAERADKLETKLNRLGTLGGAGNAAVDVDVKAAAEFSRQRGVQMTAEGMREYRAALDAYMRRGTAAPASVMNTLQVGSDPDGGYWVPPDRTGKIVSKIYETSPMRQFADIMTTGSDRVEGMVDDGEASSGWVGETDSVTRDTETASAQVGMWAIPVNEQYAMPLITQKLLDDAQFDVSAWHDRKVADKMARVENAAFVNGDGNRKPRGFLQYTYVTTGDLTRAWGQLQYVATGAAGAFATSAPADKLYDLVYSLKAGYRTGAAWMMARATVGTIRKFKDGNGQYLWQPGLQMGQPSTLLNFPIGEAEDMPAIAANSLSIAFGNFREGYLIVDRTGIRVLRDPYTKKGFVKFYTTKRVGGDVVNFEAIKALKFAAS